MLHELSPAAGDTGAPLLADKLIAPPLPESVLARTRLLDRLDKAAFRPVTMVRAPAGWGKSTLLGSWYQARRETLDLAWLSLEPADSGNRFFAYLHAVLTGGEADPEASDDQAYVERLAAALASRSAPMVLILDDLHHIGDRRCLAGLEFLLRHCEQRLRLVIGARVEPLSALHRLRADGDLTELGVADLAFTPEETTDLLAAYDIYLPGAGSLELTCRAEGWPVGLRLAALAMREHPDPARFVAEFGGDQPEIADYLTAEVLAGLSENQRVTLLRVAVTEPVSGDLLDTLTGRDGGERQLAELARLTGFLNPLGGRPVTYRCHRLLGDLLRVRAEQEPLAQRRKLHSQAAGWYASNGRPVDALRHTLAARQWQQASDLLRHRWPELLPYERDEVSGPVVLTPPEEQARAQPALALACAVLRLHAAQPSAAVDLLHRAAEADLPHQSPQGEESLRRAAAALELCRAQLDGQPEEVRTAAARLIRLAVPGGDDREDTAVRAVAHTALGLAEAAVGRLPDAREELSVGLAEARHAGLARVALAARSRLALVAAARGDLRSAEQWARDVLAEPPCQGRPCRLDRAYAYLSLALVALHRDRTEQAEANLSRVAWSADDRYASTLVVFAALCRTELSRDRGEQPDGYRALAQTRAELGDPLPAELDHLFRAVEAELRIDHGDLSGARDLLRERSGQSPEMAVAFARAELCAGDLGAAERGLPDWDGPGASECPLPVRLAAGVLDARLARERGDARRAARLLERVLALAEPEGFRRVLRLGGPAVRDLLATHLDSGTAYWPTISDLLRGDGLGETIPDNAAHLEEPLTEREMVVLRYLQSILSNVEIAGELCVSVNTVKTHVRNIYRKLNATRRREAVQRARELRLI